MIKTVLSRQPIASFIALATVLIAFCVAPVASQTSGYERLPSFDAQQVLPPALHRGPHHSIDNSVRNDGFHNTYVMKSKFGEFSITGTELLKVRVREAEAAAKLSEVSASGQMLKSAGRTAVKPLKTAEGLVTKPGATLKGTFKGVGRFFGRVGAGLGATDPQKESTIGSITGAGESKRRLAHRLGVDPYTRFVPLSDELSRLASASALGGTATGVGMAFVSGGAGLAISVGSTSENLRSFLRDKTAAELEQIGRQELHAIDVPETTINEFYRNQFLTPTDKAIIVHALGNIGGAYNRSAVVLRAAQVSTQPRAFALRRRIELMSVYHSKVARVESFVDFGGIPMVRTSKGICAIFAIDYLPWTREFEQMVKAANSDRAKVVGNVRIDFWITGRASKRTIANLDRLGWRLIENAGDQLGG